jgi:hypothetical protein
VNLRNLVSFSIISCSIIIVGKNREVIYQPADSPFLPPVIGRTNAFVLKTISANWGMDPTAEKAFTQSLISGGGLWSSQSLPLSLE